MAEPGAVHLVAATRHFAPVAPSLAESLARALVDRLAAFSTTSASACMAPGEVCPACGALWNLCGMRVWRGASKTTSRQRQRIRQRGGTKEVRVGCVCGAEAAVSRSDTAAPRDRGRLAKASGKGGVAANAATQKQKAAAKEAIVAAAAHPHGKVQGGQAGAAAATEGPKTGLPSAAAKGVAQGSGGKKSKKNKLGKALSSLGGGGGKGKAGKDKRFSLGDFLSELT